MHVNDMIIATPKGIKFHSLGIILMFSISTINGMMVLVI